MMQHLSHTLSEYKESRELLIKRVAELNLAINRANKQGQPVAKFIQRRHYLYLEIAEMSSSIRSMEEYLSNT